jgi:hypothetical protein
LSPKSSWKSQKHVHLLFCLNLWAPPPSRSLAQTALGWISGGGVGVRISGAQGSLPCSPSAVTPYSRERALNLSSHSGNTHTHTHTHTHTRPSLLRPFLD